MPLFRHSHDSLNATFVQWPFWLKNKVAQPKFLLAPPNCSAHPRLLDEDELVELGHAEMAHREAFGREFVLPVVVKVLQMCR